MRQTQEARNRNIGKYDTQKKTQEAQKENRRK